MQSAWINHKGRKLYVVGASGTGKTTLALRYIGGEITDGCQVFVYDHKGEIASRLGVPMWALNNCIEQAAQGFPLLCHDASGEFPGRLEEGFDVWTESVYAFCSQPFDDNPQRKLIVVDDFQLLQSVYIAGGGFTKILENGRRHRIDVLLISQSINSIHNRIRNQITDIAVFRTVDEQAAKKLIEMGLPEALYQLPRGEYLLKSLETGELRTKSVF